LVQVMKTTSDRHADHPSHDITLREAFWVWVKVALNSFGGPAGQIAVMHKILVEEKRWVSENRFLHALNYCMLLPGPEAQQLATYIGWLLHRTRGGLIAGGLFILPGFLSILVLSIVYALYQQTTFVEALFFGLKAAVLAVVVEAVVRIGRRALKNWVMVAIAALAFAAIFFFNVPFPLIVVGAGVVGFLGGTFAPKRFNVIKGHATTAQEEQGYVITDAIAAQIRPSTRQSLRTLSIWLSLWLVPLLVIAVFAGDTVFLPIGTFFSTAATVTFGGAYSVLAYIAQQAVEVYGWLRPGEMLDGLGMAETTPGPLIQVVQFVGFMGAYRLAEGMSPITAGVVGSVLTTWVTFVPCFLWIFLGAPYIEYLRGNQRLTTALSGITAAVVGVVLNLAVWFGLHVIFATVHEVQAFGMRLLVPEWATIDWAAFVLAVGAFVALFRFKLGMIPTLLVSALLGLVYYLLVRV
jgi:chromate transporter